MKLYTVYCVYARGRRERNYFVQSWVCAADSAENAVKAAQGTFPCAPDEGPFKDAEWLVHVEDGAVMQTRSDMWTPGKVVTMKMMGI